MLEQLHIFTKYFFTIIAFFCMTILANAQNRSNPFDIKSLREINEKQQEGSDVKTSVSEKDKKPKNPFDLVPPKEALPNATVEQIQKVVAPKVSTPTVSLLEKGQQFLFGIILTVLVILTSLVMVSRNLLRRIYNSIFSDIQLRQLLRERNPVSESVYIGLYVMFLINMSIFAFLALYNFNKIFNGSELFTLMYCLLFVVLVFYGKQLIFNLLSFVFPIKKEMNLHAFIILIASILIGLILAPTNVFLAYADIATAQKVIISVGILLSVLYLFVNFRALILNRNIVFSNMLHFFLFCLVLEIIPIGIVYKLITDNIA